MLAIDLQTVLIEGMGWIGCALLIIAILQKQLLALRVLSLASAVVLAVYNAIYGVVPMVIMNVLIAAINIFYLSRRKPASACTGEVSERKQPVS